MWKAPSWQAVPMRTRWTRRHPPEPLEQQHLWRMEVVAARRCSLVVKHGLFVVWIPKHRKRTGGITDMSGPRSGKNFVDDRFFKTSIWEDCFCLGGIWPSTLEGQKTWIIMGMRYGVLIIAHLKWSVTPLQTNMEPQKMAVCTCVSFSNWPFERFQPLVFHWYDPFWLRKPAFLTNVFKFDGPTKIGTGSPWHANAIFLFEWAFTTLIF